MGNILQELLGSKKKTHKAIQVEEETTDEEEAEEEEEETDEDEKQRLKDIQVWMKKCNFHGANVYDDEENSTCGLFEDNEIECSKEECIFMKMLNTTKIGGKTK